MASVQHNSPPGDIQEWKASSLASRHGVDQDTMKRLQTLKKTTKQLADCCGGTEEYMSHLRRTLLFDAEVSRPWSNVWDNIIQSLCDVQSECLAPMLIAMNDKESKTDGTETWMNICKLTQANHPAAMARILSSGMQECVSGDVFQELNPLRCHVERVVQSWREASADAIPWYPREEIVPATAEFVRTVNSCLVIDGTHFELDIDFCLPNLGIGFISNDTNTSGAVDITNILRAAVVLRHTHTTIFSIGNIETGALRTFRMQPAARDQLVEWISRHDDAVA